MKFSVVIISLKIDKNLLTCLQSLKKSLKFLNNSSKVEILIITPDKGKIPKKMQFET